jgi:putative transposase
MRTSELKVDSKIEYFGQKYRIISIDPPNIVIKRTESDQECISIDFYQLITNPSFRINKSEMKSVERERNNYFESIIDTLPDNKREEVTRRLEIIKPIIIFENVRKKDFRAECEFYKYYGKLVREGENIHELTQETIIQRIAEKHDISERTIQRYLRGFRKAEAQYEKMGIEGLISKSGLGYIDRSDNKKLVICHPRDSSKIIDIIDVRIDECYIPILKDVIEHEYLTKKQIQVSELYRIIKTKCNIEGIVALKKITLYKLIDRISERIKSAMRMSEKENEKYTQTTRGFSNEAALYPLHMVEIDHQELDIEIIDENTGLPLGRPWISLAIDVYSRVIWSMYVGMEPPSINRVRKLILNGIFMKHAKRDYGTMNEWEVSGIPKIIYWDNGKEFRSLEVKRFVNEVLKSHVIYRPVKTPRYGGVIERMFGTLNSQMIHNLEGTRKSNPRDLGDYDPEKSAILTLKDLTELLAAYITDIYHYQPHSGLPLDENIPMIRYMEGLKRTGFPEFILESEEEFYRMEIMATDLRPYTRDGIRYENIIYGSPEFSDFIGCMGVKHKIKYDDDDISKINMLSPKTNSYVELPAVQPSFESVIGMNRYTYKKLLAILKESGERKKSEVPGARNIEQARVKYYEMLSAKYSKNKGIRKMANRSNVEFQPSITNKKESSPKKLRYEELKKLAERKQNELRGAKNE